MLAVLRTPLPPEPRIAVFFYVSTSAREPFYGLFFALIFLNYIELPRETPFLSSDVIVYTSVEPKASEAALSRLGLRGDRIAGKNQAMTVFFR
jgi:hypothetical protein